MRIALLHTRLRVEERLLLDTFADLSIEIEPIDVRTIVFDPADRSRWADYDLVVDRSLSLSTSRTAVHILESLGVRCMNPGATIDTCADKLRTTLALEQAGLPVPATRIATDQRSTLEAVEDLGYPAVLKPTVGSWGRLMARINDRDAAEAIVEHRATLGSPDQSIFYVQEHINKPDRDLRVFVVAGEVVCAIVRSSDHWITNTARGGETSAYIPDADVTRICETASRLVNADLVAIDLLECPDRGILVNELNHSMEFRNSIDVTGVDIPRRIAEHAAELASVASGVA